MSISDLSKRVGKLLADNSPTVLTAFAVTGAVTTAILTGKASYEAAEIINLKEGVEGTAGDVTQRFKERTRLVWTLYIPPAVTLTLTVAAIVGANKIGSRRAAALAAAYSISEKAFDQYKEKVFEKLGGPKETAVRDEIAQDRIDDEPVSTREVIIAAGADVLCYDSWTGRYFESDIETLKAAQNKINYTINNDYCASLSEFFSHIGLPATGSSDEVGWNADRLLELTFSSTISENNRPCIVINYKVTPIRGYYRVN